MFSFLLTATLKTIKIFSELLLKKLSWAANNPEAVDIFFSFDHYFESCQVAILEFVLTTT